MQSDLLKYAVGKTLLFSDGAESVKLILYRIINQSLVLITLSKQAFENIVVKGESANKQPFPLFTRQNSSRLDYKILNIDRLICLPADCLNDWQMTDWLISLLARWMDGSMDGGWMDGSIHRWMDRLIDEWLSTYLLVGPTHVSIGVSF